MRVLKREIRCSVKRVRIVSVVHWKKHVSSSLRKKKMNAGDAPSPNGDISTFLQYANVSHSYRDVLVTAGITRVSHLKDAEEEDFLEYGMS